MEGVVRGNVCPIASTLAAIVAPAIVVQKRQKHKPDPHFFFSPGDDKFIQWLRECREGGIQVKTTSLIVLRYFLFMAGSLEKDTEKLHFEHFVLNSSSHPHNPRVKNA